MSNPKPSSPADLPKIGAKLSAARRAKGFAQQAVADKLGKDRIAISNWERDLNFPEVASFYRLCAMLDLSMDVLLDRTFPPQGQPTALPVAEPPAEYAAQETRNRTDEKVIRAQISGLLSPLGMEISSWSATADGIDIQIATTSTPAQERRGMRLIEANDSDRNDRPFDNQGFVSNKKKKNAKTTARKGSPR